MDHRPRRLRRWLPLLAVLASTALIAAACQVGRWKVVGVTAISGLSQDQGVATVTRPDGSTYLFFDGDTTVAPDLAAKGWTHVGDPDSSRGYIFEAYQAGDSATAAKLFRVTAPDGTKSDFVHQDVAGEAYNNSFVAITPNGQWMVSGEWGVQTRLVVYPTPILNPTAPPPSANLPLVGQILFDHPVVDIQGCSFRDSHQLLCASDDPVAENGLPRKPLVEVDLQPGSLDRHWPNGRDGRDGVVRGTVRAVGPLPLVSNCRVTAVGSWPGDFEAEGLDYDRATGLLRVIVIPPGACALNNTAMYTLSEGP